MSFFTKDFLALTQIGRFKVSIKTVLFLKKRPFELIWGTELIWGFDIVSDQVIYLLVEYNNCLTVFSATWKYRLGRLSFNFVTNLAVLTVSLMPCSWSMCIYIS